jgi:hypothetical protein
VKTGRRGFSATCFILSTRTKNNNRMEQAAEAVGDELKRIVQRLLAGEPLAAATAQVVMRALMSGKVPPAQAAAVLLAV